VSAYITEKRSRVEDGIAWASSAKIGVMVDGSRVCYAIDPAARIKLRSPECEFPRRPGMVRHVCPLPGAAMIANRCAIT